MKTLLIALFAGALLLTAASPAQAQITEGNRGKNFPRGLYGGGFSYPGVGYGGFGGDPRYRQAGMGSPGFNSKPLFKTGGKGLLSRLRRR